VVESCPASSSSQNDVPRQSGHGRKACHVNPRNLFASLLVINRILVESHLRVSEEYHHSCTPCKDTALAVFVVFIYLLTCRFSGTLGESSWFETSRVIL
jgi:hypothetical protein